MKTFKIVGPMLAAALFAATPAFALVVSINGSAQSNAGSNSTSTVSVTSASQIRITTAKDHADQEIDRREAALSSLSTRIQEMTRLNADEKTSLAAAIQTQIGTLSSLKSKINAESDITALKADIKDRKS